MGVHAEQPHETPRGSGFAAKAVTGSAWTTAQTLANKFLTVFAVLLLAKLLAPADFGLANLAVSVGSFAFVFAPFVMGDVLITEPDRFERNAPAARRIAWGSGIMLAALLAAAAIPVEHMLGKPGLAFLLMAVVIQRPLADAAFVVPNTQLRLSLAYREIAIIDGSVILAATVGGLLMAYFGMGPSSLLFPPIAMIWLRAYIYSRRVKRIPSEGLDRSLLRPIAHRFIVACTGQYLNSMLAILEVLVLGFFASETEIGLFGFASLLAIQANTVIASQLGAVLQPIFAHIKDDPARQVAAFSRATSMLASVAVPLSLVQAAVALPLFRLMFEEEWTGSIAIFVLLSIAQAFVFVSAPSIALLKAQGRFRAYFRWQGLQIATSIAAFVTAVQFGGGAASSLAAGAGLPVTDDSRSALALACASLLMWACFSPLGVWIAGRPGRLGLPRTLSVFFTPWLLAAPAAALVVACWNGLQELVDDPIADLLTLALVAPVCSAGAIAGSIWIRSDVRGDFLTMVSRLRRRRASGETR